MARQYRMKATVKPSKYSNMYWDGLLDMLRYDACKISSWRKVDGTDLYEFELVKDNTDFSFLRWESFGISTEPIR